MPDQFSPLWLDWPLNAQSSTPGIRRKHPNTLGCLDAGNVACYSRTDEAMHGLIVKTGETVAVPGLYRSINCSHTLERTFAKGDVATSCTECHKAVIWRLMRED